MKRIHRTMLLVMVAVLATAGAAANDESATATAEAIASLVMGNSFCRRRWGDEADLGPVRRTGLPRVN